ncbi:hypothetical protein [Gemmatimonas sp.]|uniref:hypothetical protein n=1 Tax=Gemmatimonas sp. TaxID=1962908 RepID=UPI003561DA2A
MPVDGQRDPVVRLAEVMSALFGSDHQGVKRDVRLVDWHDRSKLAMHTAKNRGMGWNPIAGVWHLCG